MTTAADQPDHASSPAPSTTTVGLLAKSGTFDSGLHAKLLAHRDFSLMSSLLQRRIDRLHVLKAGRQKVLGKEVTRTAKEFDVHETGEPWLSYQQAELRVREAMDDGGTLDKAALNEVLAFAPATVRLWNAHKDAKAKKKSEIDRLTTKLQRLESTRDAHLRNGIGARRKESAQAPLPGLDEPIKPFSWWDNAERQTVLDTIATEIQIITGDVAKAKAANDPAKEHAAEQDKREHEELLASLQAIGLLDGLTPDIEDETTGAEGEGDAEEDETDEDDEPEDDDEDHAPEDPTQHPDLQPAIEKQKGKAQAKKATKKAGGSQRKAGGGRRGRGK